LADGSIYYVIDGEDIVIDILDTSGQEGYTATQQQYIRSGQGFILVYSVTSRCSFENISSLRRDILRVKDSDT
jgi:GTPase KRas